MVVGDHLAPVRGGHPQRLVQPDGSVVCNFPELGDDNQESFTLPLIPTQPGAISTGQRTVSVKCSITLSSPASNRLAGAITRPGRNSARLASGVSMGAAMKV